MNRFLTAVTLAAAAVVFSTSAHAVWEQTYKFKAQPSAPYLALGDSVALSGNIAILGSQYAGGSDSGAAYLFNAATGTQIANLLPSDVVTPGDNFGKSVAVSGNVALIGSPGDIGNGNFSGSAYLFNASTGAQIAKLTPDDNEPYGEFGESVAISGNTALIGRPRAMRNGSSFDEVGAAYLFDVTTGAQITKLIPVSFPYYGRFGKSVAISGNTAVVGCPDDSNSGIAFIFNTTTGAQIAKVTPPNRLLYEYFGWSVAVSGNIAIVGSAGNWHDYSTVGSAYLYNATTGALIAKLNPPDQVEFDGFGQSVAISGNTAIVGDFFNGAYLYNATTGAQIAKLSPSGGFGTDNLGTAVAISGNAALIGSRLDNENAYFSGAGHLFAQDQLSASPLSGTNITFNPIEINSTITLDDILRISNTGGGGSTLKVIGFSLAFPDSTLFALPDYSNVTLTAGTTDTIAYDLKFLGASLVGDYSTTLRIFTDSGTLIYNVSALVYMPGDANFDNQVDGFDYSTVDDYFGQPGTIRTGDLNQDGIVDAFDYATVDDNFGTGVTSRPNATTEVLIPEPASLSLLALPGLLLSRRRR